MTAPATNPQILLALDVGEKRVGLAWADTAVKLATPLSALANDEHFETHLNKLIRSTDASKLIIGLPRNQSGQETAQSAYVRNFASKLTSVDTEIIFQDESLTSVLAEERLRARGKKYEKADIDSEAAAIILTDYLEENYG